MVPTKRQKDQLVTGVLLQGVKHRKFPNTDRSSDGRTNKQTNQPAEVMRFGSEHANMDGYAWDWYTGGNLA
jgi:hypothetical protein